MARRMTVVFHDEELYTNLKVEAARTHQPASNIVSEAVKEWLERQEDTEIIPQIEAARAEWKEKGGLPWTEVEEELDSAIEKKKRSGRSRV